MSEKKTAEEVLEELIIKLNTATNYLTGIYRTASSLEDIKKKVELTEKMVKEMLEIIKEHKDKLEFYAMKYEIAPEVLEVKEKFSDILSVLSDLYRLVYYGNISNSVVSGNIFSITEELYWLEEYIEKKIPSSKRRRKKKKGGEKCQKKS